MKCRKYKSELVLYQHIATYGDNQIVWSRRGNLHQVRYGLQTKEFFNDIDAAKEFGLSVRHSVECDGKLD